MSRSHSSRALAAGAYMTFVTLGLTVSVIGTALPFLARQTGVSLQTVSYLFIGSSLGYMAGTFCGGLLYDRLPGNRLMAGALFALVPLLALIPQLRILGALVAAYLLLGFFQGTMDTGGNILILWTPPEGRSVRMNALHLAFGAGTLLAPLILGQAVRWTGGIAWGYRALALLCLPAALWFTWMPRPLKPPAAEEIAGRSESLARVMLVAGFVFLAVAAEAGFGNWIYTYAVTRRIADAVGAAFLASVFWGSFTAGRLVFTFLSARLRPLSLLLMGMLGSLAGNILFLLLPADPVGVWAGTALIGLFIGPIVANTLTFGGEVMTITGRTAGIIMFVLSLGGLSLPWAIGQVFERVGPITMPAAVLLVLLAGLLVYTGLRRIAAPASGAAGRGSTGGRA